MTWGRRCCTPRGVILCLSATWLLHAGLNLSFLLADTDVPEWQDRLPHLQRVYDGVLYLRLHGLGGLLHAPTLSEPQWPPFVHWSSALLGYLVDPSLAALRVYNLIYVALLLIGVYWIGAEIHGRAAGLLAAWVAAAIPGLVGGSRQFGLDYPGAVLVCLGMAALVASRSFARTRAALLFGGLLGLAILARVQAAAFLAGPLLLVLIRSIHRRRWHNLMRAAVAGALALGLSAPWWSHHGPVILHDIGIHFDTGHFPAHEINSSFLQGVIYYLYSLTSASSLPLLVLCVPLAVFGLTRPSWRRGRWEILLWLLVPLAIHAASVVRLARYVLPLLPVLPIAAVIGAVSLRRRTLRWTACGGLIVLSLGTLLACHYKAISVRSPFGELGARQPGSPPIVADASGLAAYLAPGRLSADHPASWPSCGLPQRDALCCGGCLYRTLREDRISHVADRLVRTIDLHHPAGRGAALADHLSGKPRPGWQVELVLLRVQARLPRLVVLGTRDVAKGFPAWKRAALGADPTLYLVNEERWDTLPDATLVERLSSTDGAHPISLWRIGAAGRGSSL